MPKAQSKPFDAQLIDLRAFVLTVDRGSITAAAQALGETKGSVSRRLTRLERAVHAQLLQRAPRSVRATPEGLAFRERVEASLALLAEAVDEASASGEPSGTVRVTAPADFAVLLAPYLAAFGRRHPKVTVDMLLSPQQLDLESEEIDVAFRIGVGLDDSSLVARRVQELEFGFFASPGYLSEHPPLRSPQDLASHDTLVFRVRQTLVIALARGDGSGPVTHVRLAPRLRGSDAQLLCEVAMADGGIAFVPTLFADDAVRAGRLVRVLDGYVQPIKVIVHMVAKHRQIPRRVRLFLDFMAAAMQERAPRRRAPLSRHATAEPSPRPHKKLPAR